MRQNVTVRTIPSLTQNEFQTSDLLFFGKSHQFSQLAQLRCGLRRTLPICSIVHAVLFPNLFSNFLGMLIQAKSSDCLIVTSSAAEAAITSLMDQIKGRLVKVGLTQAPSMGPKVVKIPLGVDDSFLECVEKGAARKILDIPEDFLIGLYLGRLSSEYKADLEPLLRSFKTIVGYVPNAALIVAGSDTGNYASYVQALIVEFGLQERVRLF